MAKVEAVFGAGNEIIGYQFYCPGCGYHHMPYVKGRITWKFNGDVDNPTFTPSLMVNRGGLVQNQPICHSFITNGKIQYLGDCTHKLAGQTIEMEEIENNS